MNRNGLWIFVLAIITYGCKVAPYSIADSYIYKQNKNRNGTKWEVVWEAHGSGKLIRKICRSG